MYYHQPKITDISMLNSSLSNKIITIVKSITTDNYGYFLVNDLKQYIDNGYVVAVARYGSYFAFMPNYTGYLYIFDGRETPFRASNITTNLRFILIK